MEEKKTFSIIRVSKALLVVFAFFIVILYLMPHRCPSREHARGIVCTNQMQDLMKRYLTYYNLNHSYLQPDTWCDALQSYYKGEDIERLQCLCDEIGPCSYAMNENIPADAEKLPGDLVVLFESAPGWNRVGGADDVVTDRHGEAGANFGFANGDTRFVPAEEIGNLRWTVKE